MDRKKAAYLSEDWQKAKKRAIAAGGLAAVLAENAGSFYNRSSNMKIWAAVEEALGKDLNSIDTVEEFWSPVLEEALACLTDPGYAAAFRGILDRLMRSQFSESPCRRSYRSRHFRYHAYQVVRMMSCYAGDYYWEGTLADQLSQDNDSVHHSFRYRLAERLSAGDADLTARVREAIYGDNASALLTRRVIEAVILSDRENLIDDLLKLLSAAKLQEGLRQAILESADLGSKQTLRKILGFCLENDLFRFSSAVRAFDTWSGLGLGDARPAVIRKAASLAKELLDDPNRTAVYLGSDSNLECYLALWAAGCEEIEDADRLIDGLLEDPRHSRRILGWYFVTYADDAATSFRAAVRHLDERDDEILAWLLPNLPYTYKLTDFYGLTPEPAQAIRLVELPRDAGERRRIFEALREILFHFGDRRPEFSGNPFPWSFQKADPEHAVRCMMCLAGYDMDPALIEELCSLSGFMTPDRKQALIGRFLHPETEPSHRSFLFGMLSDRSVSVRELAAKRLHGIPLDEAGLAVLCDNLRTKSSALRKAILSVLSSQPEQNLERAAALLLSGTNENRIRGGLELLIGLPQGSPALEANRDAVAALREKNLSTQTSILLDQLGPKEKTVSYTKENGFGLYDPAVVEAYAASLPPVPGDPQDLLTEAQLVAFRISAEEMDALLTRLDAVIDRHADYSYEVENRYDRSRTRILLGDMVGQTVRLPFETGCYDLTDRDARPEMIPFWEEIADAFGPYLTDPFQYLRLWLACGPFYEHTIYGEKTTAPWYDALLEKELYPDLRPLKQAHGRAYAYYAIIRSLPTVMEPHGLFTGAMRLYRSFIALIGEEHMSESYQQVKGKIRSIYDRSYGINLRLVGVWRVLIHSLSLDKEDFARWFALEFRLEHGLPCEASNGLSSADFFRACEDGVAGRDILYDYLTDPMRGVPGKIRVLTQPLKYRSEGKKLYDRHPWAAESVRILVDRLVEVEAMRGEMRTPVTGLCLGIEHLEGADHFCRLLAALGKETFFRGYEFSSEDTKQAVLSRLLKRCFPAKEDTPERLAALLKQTDLPDKRLAEAVMYAPQWAGFAEQILGWDGLKCGVWYFHAHISEHFSAEKETETALYSPITPQEFNDGAFDRNWFLEAYGKLGEKRFDTLYRSAKYITSGSSQHRRSQLYADAVLGRLNGQELEREIVDKRNQEKLRAWPLLPVAPGDEAETLRRYEFIQRFLKESRQFGAQRRESEKKACMSALGNLAVAAGYDDVNRLTWQMESAKSGNLLPLLQPREICGCIVKLTVDENGTAALSVEKNGKPLKTVPKDLGKDPEYLDLKETVKDLKEQKRRAAESMERAMTEASLFGEAEIRGILRSPVLRPLVERILWVCGGTIGLLKAKEARGPEGGSLLLEQADGTVSPVKDDLRPAHPHDLRTAGVWADWMHRFYEERFLQPFKQVFREYYPLTEEERDERTLSRRYAGHQVQPQRAAALLKSRGWTVDYEEGLQKVFYGQDLVVRLYAAADWFSPADIEPPTLETVEFFSRRTGENVPLEEIPPILFSETMRDLDLAVSVAHAGGVDPESSRSTVEMRTAIAQELVRLLKLDNVRWTGSHARIDGKLATYSVHMGSGVVHAEGIGSIAIVAVNSQTRGRIFLPFADDDPKTAEILSKILLLAEDRKLKDPAILAQLR